MSNHGMRNGNSYKNQYKAYQLDNRRQKNKIRKLQRHVKNQPNNQIAKDILKAAINADPTTYTRNIKPKNKLKGLIDIFGYSEGKVPPKSYKIKWSYIWHTSSNYEKWRTSGDAPKVTKTLNVRNTLNDIELRSV